MPFSARRTTIANLLLSGLFTTFVFGQTALAGTRCVNPAGSQGCYATIGAAVSAAAANDIINIAPGSYAENVVVNKPLSLVGSGPESTIINAKGLANGIYVDGLDNPGLSGVIVTGLTVMNANFEGILLTNVSYSMITENHVTDNDQSLNYAAGTCPGLPVFETNEGEDCGEGIHLVGVDHTTVANNTVDLNSGGILLSDETGQTHDNMILGNNVHENALDCGITLASHAPSPKASSPLPYGIFNNTIQGNIASGNGRVGAGAGIGIFAPGPGNMNFGNKVIGNLIMNNGIPGVSIHNHAAPPGAPPVNLNDNVIVGNFISGNGADDADASTAGPTGINVYGVAPIYGTVIAENTIVNEAFDVVMNNPGAMETHLNNLLGGKTGVANLGKGVVSATVNFWGCPGGAGATGCAVAQGPVTAAPALSAPAGSAPAPASGGTRKQ
ncbi:MAG TPA: right-handed parallel beta-helix repeat-containing protein [Bryobacteraceae bacterium]|nr:right-handed parallel beta-helix repeat-containing protein [Bryobacteraceae bacterium]